MEVFIFTSTPREIGPAGHLDHCRAITEGTFPGVKWPEREVDHLHPSSVEVENAWSSTINFPDVLYGYETVSPKEKGID